MRQALHPPSADPDRADNDALGPNPLDLPIDDDVEPDVEPAYAVPLRVDRSAAPCYRLFNVGHERLVGVTFSLLGSGAMPSRAPQTLDVGAALDVVIRGDDLARRTVLVVRWFRPTGEEYLWRVSF